VAEHPANDDRDDRDAEEEQGASGSVPEGSGRDSADFPGELSFIGALGIDPDQPDPGCEHDWRNLHFLENDEGITCLRCARAWAVDEGDSRDAVFTLWNSTRRAIEDLALQQERLTRIVEEITGNVRCHWCNRWSDDTDEFVAVQRRRACPEHLGQLLGEIAPADDDDLDTVRNWLRDALGTQGRDVYTTWLVEKAVVECPELTNSLDALHLTIDAVGGQEIELPAAWATPLGLPTSVTVNAISSGVAKLLDLPHPISRPGRAFLLGALARAVHAWELGVPLDAETLTATLMEAAPSGNRDRATIILDLYREEMQVDGTVTGEMADDLVEALIGRAASEFSGRAPAAPEPPEERSAQPDPR